MKKVEFISEVKEIISTTDNLADSVGSLYSNHPVEEIIGKSENESLLRQIIAETAEKLRDISKDLNNTLDLLED